MSLRQRSFRGDADWAAMAAVVQAQPADHLHLIDLPYRLCSWAFDDPANAALWEDAAGAVRAWAALQTPFWSIDYALDPAAPAGALQALLAWVAQRARAVRGTPFARPAWFISSPAGHPHNAELEAAGFRSQADVGPNSWTKVLFRRDCVPAPATRALPEGFQIRPLGGAAEVEAYVSLHQAVFQSENMTVAWRRRTLDHPAYRPDLDLVLVDGDGRLAGFCVGWLTAQGPERAPAGQIEPMGVRADLRGRGHGQALLNACLARLIEAGARSLFVETDNDRDAAFGLYTAAGFTIAREVVVYRREVDEVTTSPISTALTPQGSP
jgi:ribosomal protein S18 acetylase RimI-like enzyme